MGLSIEVPVRVVASPRTGVGAERPLSGRRDLVSCATRLQNIMPEIRMRKGRACASTVSDLEDYRHANSSHVLFRQ
jgi:hypothetical protein